MFKFISSVKKNFILISLIFIGGCASSGIVLKEQNEQVEFDYLNLDTVKAGKFDTGKMWTFEYPPIEYFSEEYNFVPTEEWLNHVRLSALRFANYCSASFVSGDGLIMTNNHCARESVVDISGEGEDFHKNGFYAETLEEERRVENLYVDQLVLIKDVTDEVQAAGEKGKSDEDKYWFEQEIIEEIEARENEATGFETSVTELYDGGKYSLYYYKRYNDVRLVFSPEHLLGHFGGDEDNFTYPRYNLDAAFFRVYDELGEPLETENYFKWSNEGIKPGETVFVVGNPGSTERLRTIAQLEYFRDILYPRTLDAYKNLLTIYNDLLESGEQDSTEVEVQVLRYQNAVKAYEGMLRGLRNPVLMKKKKDFEEKFKKRVFANPVLKKEYGELWNNIAKNQKRMSEISNELYALSVSAAFSSDYFLVAYDLVNLAYELKLPEEDRSEYYKGEELDKTIKFLIPPDLGDEEDNFLLKEKLNDLINIIGYDNIIVADFTDGKNADEAAEEILSKSSLTTKEKILNLIDKGPDAILNSDDPFIRFVMEAEPRKARLNNELENLSAKEDEYNEELGKALFAVFGTSIPPDATFTLRISDGVVKGYPYNGTVAPPVTTFYGLYDRYYSFGKKYPWDLPEKWLNPPPEFNLETPFNFVSTNDITGGNSGSPVINKDGEVVGVAFDGNIESLPGTFIYDETENRMVSVHSEGIMEALLDLYKADRIAEELKSGKINSEEVTAN